MRLNAHVHVVHIQDMDDEPLDPDCDSWESQSRTAIAAAETSAHDEFSTGDVSWEYHRAHGPAAVQLLGVAQQCDALMIILGSPRGGPASALDTLLGQSVSHRLIGARRVPLVLVAGALTTRPDLLWAYPHVVSGGSPRKWASASSGRTTSAKVSSLGLTTHTHLAPPYSGCGKIRSDSV